MSILRQERPLATVGGRSAVGLAGVWLWHTWDYHPPLLVFGGPADALYESRTSGQRLESGTALDLLRRRQPSLSTAPSERRVSV
jgi:hypothetical protein